MIDNTLGTEPLGSYDRTPIANLSGVSWAAVIAGAAGAAALSLILLVLGVGLGLSAVSPWASEGMSATGFGVSTIAWLTFTQLAASGAGGYLAGRLRSRWANVHTDEVYFRDTAHGFLAWAVATLATAAMLGSAIGAVVGGGAKAGAAVAGGAATTVAAAAVPAVATAASSAGNGSAYFVDALFRPGAPAAPTTDAAASAPAGPASSSENTRSNNGSRQPASGGVATASNAEIPAAEVGRIFANAMSGGALPPEDARYVGALVADRTGLSQTEAEKRVTDGFNRLQAKAADAEAKAREAADKARKATSYAALWTFVSLLIGAFVASLAATFGGRQRDLI